MIDFVKEFFAFMRARRKLWLIPLLVILVVFGGLIFLAQGTAIAPFIYTIF